MIAAVVAVRRWIGPVEVLQAAPLRMRVQFWLLVGSGIALATVPVIARGEAVAVESWSTDWRFVSTVALWIFSAGAVWAQFNDLKARLAKLEASSVGKDKLDDKIELMTTKIDQLHELLKRTDREWRDSLHGSKE